MEFTEPNSTNFPINVKNNLTSISKSYSQKDFLKYHQHIAHEYLVKNSSARGLLIYHEMGYGKSILAVSIAEYFRRTSSKKIIVLLTKSLVSNFKTNIRKYIAGNLKDYEFEGDPEGEVNNIVESYKFISMNASNMFSQMTRVNKDKETMEMEKKLNSFADVIEKDDFLEGSVLIIDEFHNLSNSITNGSYNAVRLYDAILKTKNLKLLFLTGTPIINHPFELVPTFNMLAGGIKLGEVQTTLFPELKKNFDKYFIDEKHNKIKNASKFQNRIFGMCSYYGSMYFGNKKSSDFPAELEMKVEEVHMSPDQYARYDAARDLEKEENATSGRSARTERFAAKGSKNSSYRVKSRQISNYLIPEYALGPPRGNKARVKYVDKITKQDLLNTKEFSPKFGRILQNISKHPKQLGFFYSEFVSGEGIAIFARILDAKGYKCFNRNKSAAEDAEILDINLANPQKEKKEGKKEGKKDKKEGKKEGKGKKGGGGVKCPTYAIISGDVDVDTREEIVKKFNHKDNICGKNISLLIVSKTGAEGLDLKNVRHIHICEPYWNYARISQLIARGVRFKSHTDLPEKERTVQPYIYLSTYPTNFKKTKKVDLTTDEHLYFDSVKAKILIKQFLITLVGASVDCGIHESEFGKEAKKEIKCKMCSPNDKPLYHPLISRDMALPDPCEKLQKKSIKLKGIDVDGAKYYYHVDSDGSHTIFKYDNNLKGYVIVQQHEYPHSIIMRKLLGLE